jgi:hypothetical protein
MERVIPNIKNNEFGCPALKRIRFTIKFRSCNLKNQIMVSQREPLINGYFGDQKHRHCQANDADCGRSVRKVIPTCVEKPSIDSDFWFLLISIYLEYRRAESR